MATTRMLKVPPGSYQVYTESLNGVVQPGNLYFTPFQTAQVQQFMATRFMRAQWPLLPTNTSTVNISVPGGARRRFRCRMSRRPA